MPEPLENPDELKTTEVSTPVLRPRQLISGRYLLTRILGQGGMGVVWLAEDQKLNREVALKLLPDAIATDRAAIETLKEETRKSLELTHPNIVRIHDLIEDGTIAAISMEHVAGSNLAALKARRRPPVFEPADLLPWLTQLASALDYAHQNRRIAHRDIKPSNVMIADSGELKLADFGIARDISDSLSRITGPARVSGTLAYMSPQQLDGAPPKISDDIYSFGATIYDLLAGRPPFHSGDIPHQIRYSPPVSMAERRRQLQIEAGEIPQEWEQLVSQCLEKSPEKRPSSTGEIVAGLRESLITPRKMIVPGEEVPPEPDPIGSDDPPERKFSRPLLAVILVATLVACFGIWRFVERPKHRNSEAQQQSLQKQPENKTAVAEAKTQEPARPVLILPDLKLKRWTNSLGQIFVPVDNTRVLFSIWETRAGDFEQFVNDTGYRADSMVGSMRTDGWKFAGDTWRELAPTSNHPACGLSWEDGTEFCRWLTTRERASGVIGPEDEYRLPRDAEWSMAYGNSLFPWGSEWPPPSGYANLCGEEEKDTNWLTGYKPIRGYKDGFARTAPVGSFPPNRFGIHDLTGNVYEYCEDFYRASLFPRVLLEKVPQLKQDGGGMKFRIMRGGSWADNQNTPLLTEFREATTTDRRFDNRGFRCVLEPRRTTGATSNQ